MLGSVKRHCEDRRDGRREFLSRSFVSRGFLSRGFVSRGFLSDDRAATTIEFAFLAPMFFLVLLSVLEVSMISTTRASIKSGLADATRLVRTGQGQCLKDADAIKTICDMAFAPNCEGSMTLERERFPTGLSGASVAAASFNDLLADEIVLVRATYPWSVVNPMLRPFFGDANGEHQIQQSFVFKNEGFIRASC